MRMHIVDDYDYDCEIIQEGSEEAKYLYVGDRDKVYEIPDEVVEEYASINKRRQELKDKILLIERQGRL